MPKQTFFYTKNCLSIYLNHFIYIFNVQYLIYVLAMYVYAKGCHACQVVTGHNDVISMSNILVCVVIFVLRVKPRLTITVCAWLLRRRRGPSSGVRLGEGA